MRITFALPGIHRVQRGAEVALEAIARELAGSGHDSVTVLGSGPPSEQPSYNYRRHGLIPRERFERFPKVPPFRTEYIYEEATWAVRALPSLISQDTDLTVTCSYPFVNWLLNLPVPKKRPPNIFITQNGDWPSFSEHLEYRMFRCDGLVCTNPLYFERNRARWHSKLIPNGIDPNRFAPGPSVRERFGLPEDVSIVLMASALVESKRVLEAIRVLSQIPNIFVVVAGDGHLRGHFDELVAELMPGRALRMTISSDLMPDLYRSCDVLLHPTLWESFGNVYIEAMAVGLPVIAHDYEVTRWIFGDYPGLINATVDYQIADAVVQALSAKSPIYGTYSSDARERFAWPAIARQYRDFFADVVARDGSEHNDA